MFLSCFNHSVYLCTINFRYDRVTDKMVFDDNLWIFFLSSP